MTLRVRWLLWKPCRLPDPRLLNVWVVQVALLLESAIEFYSRGALHAMPERTMPEIQRTALESTCLQTCSMTNDGVENFLRRALDPPSEEAISFAMDRLVKLDAINVNTGHGEILSPLGRCLARLPLDPAIGRMLLMGCIMNCLGPVLTAAAYYSSRDPFYTPPGMRDRGKSN